MRLVEPHDQASGLRRLFAAERLFRAVGVLGPDARRNARVSAGLGLALGRRGSQALILDEATAPHNVASLLGVLTRHSLLDVAKAGELARAIQTAGPGVDLLAAHDGIAALAHLDERELMRLADDWRDHAEMPQWLLLNSAANSGRSLSATADLRILVLPGSKNRLAEAYTVLKSAHMLWPGKFWLVVVEGVDAHSGDTLFSTLQETAQRFLGIEISLLGTLPPRREGAHPILADADVIGAIHSQTGGAARNSDLSMMAERLITLPVGDGMEFEQYWQRMWLYCRMTVEMENKRPLPYAPGRALTQPAGNVNAARRPRVFDKGT